MLFFDRVFFRFIITGGVNTLVGMVIMFTLYNMAGLSYWVSSGANYFFTSVMSFFLNKYFTFQTRDWSFRMVAAFVLTIAASYALAYGIARPLAALLFAGLDPRLRGNISLFAGMCLFTLINYCGQRFFVFRKPPPKEQPDEKDPSP
jgi:putative flippase GtrA